MREKKGPWTYIDDVVAAQIMKKGDRDEETQEGAQGQVSVCEGVGHRRVCVNRLRGRLSALKHGFGF